ncbi:thiamine phosphate synthase [Paenibacillus gansuensis]|uniref:Thiamine-phosphate synthase n=1 Tax=Paenibacillus gansuensis TaxID=306542 RepID=A0ABW5P9H4_9BACL
MLQLYFVAGTPDCPGGDLARVLAEAIRGGITAYQFREKGPGALHGRARFELAAQLRELCASAGVPFIVNDDVELALALSADGVHVGQTDAPAAEVRRRIGAMLLGVSAHDAGEARRAAADGADYLGVGPMYPTATKLDARTVQGPGVLSRLRESGLMLPIVGIGGITAARAAAVTGAGADGIAVVSAISRAADPFRAAQQFSTPGSLAYRD